MELRLIDNLKAVFILIILLSSGSSEDLDFNFCGTWRHGKGPLSLNVNLSPGCNGISITANESSLSIDGQITAKCNRSDVIPLDQFGLDSSKDSYFCLYWEPLLDQLKLQVGGKNLTLCWPASLQGSCCTDLTNGPFTSRASYGVINGTVNSDIISHDIRTGYIFNGSSIDCSELCDRVDQESTQVNMFQDVGIFEHPCAYSFIQMVEEEAST